MATITYRCDVCKRETDVLENTSGITVFNKCIITQNCKGELHSIRRNRDSTRESLPDYSSYDNYSPRLVFHEHKQFVNSSIWNVTHNLNCLPAITVFKLVDSNTYEIIPQDEYIITVINSNECTLTFNNQLTGIAHILSRNGSVTTITQQISQDELVKVTANGGLTLSTPKYIVLGGVVSELTTTIRLQVEVIKPNQEIIYCYEDFEPTISTSSPWYTWPNILLRKRKQYKNRSKNIATFRTIQDETIPDGTLFRFTGVDYNDSGSYVPIESKFVIFLLASPPYTQYDKNVKQICDIGEMLNTQNNFFVYKDGEFFTNITNIESTYPDIIKS